jgi:4'-phosphopantetheinyl transferase
VITADASLDRPLPPLVPAQGRCGWLIGALRDVPDTDDWLTAGERVRLAQLHLAKRRADWRLGRWVAKRAVGAALACDPDRIAVIATESGAPLALRDGVPAPVALSLSHAAGRGLCAVAPPGVAVGCDLEPLAPRSAAFVRDYFTAAEQRRIAGDDRLATLFWCAKEAVLKALGDGLRRDLREAEVASAAGDRRLVVDCAGRRFAARWWVTDGLVAVIAS